MFILSYILASYFYLLNIVRNWKLFCHIVIKLVMENNFGTRVQSVRKSCTHKIRLFQDMFVTSRWLNGLAGTLKIDLISKNCYLEL